MIVVEHLSKYYGNNRAIDDLNFTIEDGKIYGLLGPNGAGKSTTMNIMTGCLSMSDGSVSIDGHDIFEEPLEAKKLLGYLPEIPPLYVDCVVEDYLKFVGEAKGLKKDELKAAIDKAISETQIEEVRGRLIKHLSKGYRQRVGMAQALLGNPQVIILDEPTVGLDPLQIVEIRDLIKELGKSHTIILSSHILSEVQNICEEVLIINKGKLVAFDSVDKLEDLFTKEAIIECAIEGDADQELLTGIDGVKDIKINKDNNQSLYELSVDKELIDTIKKEIFNRCVEKSLSILELKTKKADLEDIFMEIAKSEVEEEVIEEEYEEDDEDDSGL